MYNGKFKHVGDKEHLNKMFNLKNKLRVNLFMMRNNFDTSTKYFKEKLLDLNLSDDIEIFEEKSSYMLSFEFIKEL